MNRRHEKELEVAELKMMRWVLGVTRLDRIGSDYIRGRGRIIKIGKKVRSARPRWFSHVQRREEGCVEKRVPKMKISGKRRRGRPARRWMDVIREDMEEPGLEEEDEEDRDKWRKLARCGDPA